MHSGQIDLLRTVAMWIQSACVTAQGVSVLAARRPCLLVSLLTSKLAMTKVSMVIFILTYLFLLRIFLADVHCTVHTVYRNSQSSISFSKEPTAHSILAFFNNADFYLTKSIFLYLTFFSFLSQLVPNSFRLLPFPIQRPAPTLKG